MLFTAGLHGVCEAVDVFTITGHHTRTMATTPELSVRITELRVTIPDYVSGYQSYMSGRMSVHINQSCILDQPMTKKFYLSNSSLLCSQIVIWYMGN